MSSSSKVVDDRDANGQFNGQWQQGGVAQENNHSTTYTSEKGAQAQFTFTGTKISVYGTVASKKQPEQKHNPESTYKIDDGSETKFTGNLADDVVFRQLFFKSDDLSDGNHTLTVTNQVEDAFLYIDYLEIQPSTPSTTLSTKSPSTNTAPVEQATVVNHATITTIIDYTPSATPDSTGGAAALGASKATSAATKIAAGIFGGIVGVAFLAAIIVIALKRRRDKKRDEAVDYYASQSAWHQKPEYQG